MQMDQLISVNLLVQSVSARALSQVSVSTASDALQQKIQAEIQNSNLGSIGFQNIMLLLQGSPANSALSTNTFQTSVADSGHYETINTFYPRHRDARFQNVSKTFEHLTFSSSITSELIGEDPTRRDYALFLSYQQPNLVFCV